MAEHPFFPDLKKYTLEDLDKKYSELMKRYDICKRQNMGQHVENQIIAMIESVIAEKDERFQEMSKKLEEKQKAKETKKINPNVVIDTDPIEIYKPNDL